TLAAQPDRTRLLRSLVVVFGWAYVVRYVALAALADPQAGWTRRLLTVLLEGATAGPIEGEATAPLAGYVAFATVSLYMIGLVLLPRPARPSPWWRHARVKSSNSARPGRGQRLRIAASTLYGPAPRAAMYRNRKQYTTASSPLLMIGQKPPLAWTMK